jgi:hypothetical protein
MATPVPSKCRQENSLNFLFPEAQSARLEKYGVAQVEKPVPKVKVEDSSGLDPSSSRS